MVYRKRVLALALAASLVFGTALTASAATGSPVTPVTPTPTPTPTPTVAPTTAPATDALDDNTKDHNDNTVISTIKDGKATVIKVEADNNTAAGRNVTLSVAQDPTTKQSVPIVAVNKNVFSSSKGQIVTNVIVRPQGANTIVIKTKAFNKSKVKKLTLDLGATGKVKIQKNAFKKLKTKKQKITIIIKAKKASQVKANKKAFAKLGKKSVIKVKKTMSKKEFKKLKKQLKKAGFKGKIKRA